MKVRSTIKVSAYKVIWRAVEEGVRYGWRRAHKHTETPDEETVLSAIEDAVLSELCEILEFDGC
jgi:hypothetical protein